MAKNKSINVILNLKDKFSNPLKKTTQQTKKFERDVKRAENNIKKGFDNMAKSAKNNAKQMTSEFGHAIDDMTKKAAKWATIGAGGMLVAKGVKDILNTGRSFEQGMANVGATIGVDKSTVEGIKTFEALEKKARDVAKVSAFSATEVSDAMNYLAMAGWKTEQMLGDGLEKILQLASASSTDLALTSDILTDALTAFGLTANDAGKFADIMAAAASNANTNVQMMGETFKYAAPVAGALGHSAQDTALAIGLMGNAGIKSSMAGTALRNIMTKLQGVIRLSGVNLGNVAIQTTNADGSMRKFRDVLIDLRGAFSKMTASEKAMSAEALVGANGMSGLLAIVSASEDDFNKLATAIDNSKDATARMEQTMLDTVNGAWAMLKSAIEEIQLRIWSKFKTPLKNFINAITDKLPNAFNKLVSVFRKVQSIFHRITNEIRYMWDTMVQKIANVLANHSDSITKIIDIYYYLKQVGQLVGQGLKDAFTQIEPVVQWLMHTGIPNIADRLLSIADRAFHVYQVIKDNWGLIVPIVAGVSSAILAYKAIMFTSAAAVAVYNGVMAICRGITIAMAVAQGGLNAMFVASPIGWVVLAIGALVAVGVALIMNWDKIKTTGKTLWDNLKTWVGDFANFFIRKINGCIEGLNSLFTFKMPDFLGGKEFGLDIKQIPEFATGTSYHRGGLARINEGGRGEIVNLPNGTQVVPNSISKQSAGSSATVTVPITIQGNVYGDRELVDRVGGMIAQRVKLAIGNV